MICEIKEYESLLVDSILLGNYAPGANKFFLVKPEATRLYPDFSVLLILRRFLYPSHVNDWQDMPIEVRKERIKIASLALLCWLGDQETIEDPLTKELLKEEYDHLVKDHKGAYQIFTETEAGKNLSKNRMKGIYKLKNQDREFFSYKLYSGIYNIAEPTLDLLISEAIALGPLSRAVIAVKKENLPLLRDTIKSYCYLDGKNMVKKIDNKIGVVIALTGYIKFYQKYHYDGKEDHPVAISDLELRSKLDDTHLLEADGSRFVIKGMANVPINKEEALEDSSITSFGIIDKYQGITKGYLAQKEISQYIEIFDDIEEANKQGYYTAYGTGPEVVDIFQTYINSL